MNVPGQFGPDIDDDRRVGLRNAWPEPRDNNRFLDKRIADLEAELNVERRNRQQHRARTDAPDQEGHQ